MFVVSGTTAFLFLWRSKVGSLQTGRTSLPVPKVFAYSSEENPVGVEWILMEYIRGVELGKAWKELDYDKKAQFTADLVDIYDQLSHLRADCCGAIYHSTRRSMDISSTTSSLRIIHSPRWKALSSKSLQSLRAHCERPLCDGDGLYELGPIQDGALLQYPLVVPTPSGFHHFRLLSSESAS